MKDYRIVILPRSFFAAMPGSDTLFGALMAGYKQLYQVDDHTLTDYVRAWHSNPDLLLSSAFPVYRANRTEIPFFPMPQTPELLYEQMTACAEKTASEKREKRTSAKQSMVEVADCSKKLRKIQYVAGDLFEKIASGTLDRMALIQGLLTASPSFKTANHLLMSATAGIPPENLEWRGDQSMQKNRIDRTTDSTTPGGATFYENRMHIMQESWAMWFYLRIPEDKAEMWRAILRYLGDTGITANRSTGGGKFSLLAMEPASLPGMPSGDCFVTLSRFLPQTREIDAANSLYAVSPVRSKVDNDSIPGVDDILKSKLLYIQEGSLIRPNARQSFYGNSPKIKTVAGQIEVYQYGFAYPVWAKFPREHVRPEGAKP